jgi:hypothetical protein
VSDERRRLNRWQLVYLLRVFDEPTGELLGHVVDLNADGMMLVGSSPIAQERYFSLWMELPREAGNRQRIMLHAQSLWSRPDVTPGLYASGLRLIKPSPDALHHIQGVIGLLGF